MMLATSSSIFLRVMMAGSLSSFMSGDMRSISTRSALMLTSTAAGVNMGLLFLETTLATRLVSTSEFGLYVLVIAIVNFAMMVVDFGSKTAVTQLIARADVLVRR